ncbi:MAG: indolepyruvate ferredoxin oxidoreductase subunit alpha [Anaerolineae bacterium]|jgi:indolepyruvate ferredoxin oxidoreductase, alpha subunit|nr:indolepyruvate ferredoxin oxidoreductase subunit alpha [Anaerolineae bacterium]MBT7070046.1 indolepyruvate ferredoxin oxidoreductase subunit alpha [Anaerolineae bacterium]MBT7323615.1 indolepyruvate ferredoxin oxidoreductase subunit alpha [Anaerolineae bacterium]
MTEELVKRLLSGNEALARGAWEAGVEVASGYPGTPSTEILEVFAKMPNVYAEWAPNEKVALDVAVGAAYAGKRALATMKHVGVNVAADSLFYAAFTGMEAGLVIISADDPSMHSSQNEQDNRNYAKFARIPCLDPADSQEAKDMMIAAFEISETFDTPVLLRPTTRVCHTSSLLLASPDRYQAPDPKKYPRNHAKYVMVPANARGRHPVVEKRLEKLAAFAEETALNFVEQRSTELGIITNGIAYQYAREVFPEASVLKLGISYPLPQNMIRDFAGKMDKVIVLEELDPFIEEQVLLMGVDLYKPDGWTRGQYPHFKSIFPMIGELDPKVVRTYAVRAGLLPENIGSKPKAEFATSARVEIPVMLTENLPNRPPVLCPGCPHRSTFYILNKLKRPINGDIGCYTLGVVPPLSAMDTCGCMGASTGVAHGGVMAGDSERHFAVIGDSTFFHTGVQALMNVAYNGSNVITIIMDNRITSMTGQQENPGSGLTLQGKPANEVDIEALVRAIGIKTVKRVEAYDVDAIESTLKEWLKIDEPAVLITDHACALLPEERKQYLALDVIEEDCNGCTLCFRIGCPAIIKSEKLDEKTQRPLAEIDPLLCTGCEICSQVCPRDAILFREQVLARLEN